MIFKEENGRCFAELRNGGVIEFESAEEMRAVEREWGEIQTLFGHELENAKRKTQNAKLRGVPGKKKVRITIDTDVEHIGGARNTSSVTAKPCHLLPLEKAKEKALA